MLDGFVCTWEYIPINKKDSNMQTINFKYETEDFGTLEVTAQVHKGSLSDPSDPSDAEIEQVQMMNGKGVFLDVTAFITPELEEYLIESAFEAV